MRPLTPGALLSARYRLEAPLGTGATATVWRARDVELGRAVAVKVLGDGGVEPELAARFVREGHILGRLSHPNIVPVLAAGDDEGRPYLVMALVEGPTLQERVADGPLPIDDAVDIVRAVAAGLAEAHRLGVVHRDVKPGNIVCGDDGVPHLVDWGIARAGDLTTMTRADVVMGTAAYLAPEQALGEPPEPASDVYALGCVLYELLTGAQPFPAASAVAVAYRHVHDQVPMASALRPEVPGALEAIVARCLAKRPGDRHADAGALGDALDRWRRGADDATGVLAAVHAPPADATAVLPVTTAGGMAPSAGVAARSSARRALVVAGAIAAGVAAVALVGMTTDPGDGTSPPATSPSSVAPAIESTTTTAAPIVSVDLDLDGEDDDEDGPPGKGKGKGGKD